MSGRRGWSNGSKRPATAPHIEDQQWTLVGVSGLMATMFHVRLSLPAMSAVPRRLDWIPQQPA